MYIKVLWDWPPSTSFSGSRLKRLLLKHANTLGTPSLGPSMPGMKSILGPIQLKGLTMVNSSPFSAPSARSTSQSIALHMHRTTSASQLDRKCRGKYLQRGHSKQDPKIMDYPWVKSNPRFSHKLHKWKSE
nr:hypothetical protein TorRG33x02_342330 [Ipomoea batatas]